MYSRRRSCRNRGLADGVLAGLDAGPRAVVHHGPILDLVQGGSRGDVARLPSLHDFEIREYEGDDPERGHREAQREIATAELHSLRCDTTLKLDIAERFETRSTSYNVDFRGRAYPCHLI